jgi:hypothetical protein
LLRTLVIEYYSSTLRVGNFQQKNNSAEDGIDETNGLFRIQPVRGKEEKKRKMLGIPYSGSKKEASSRNLVPNHSAEEKTTRSSVPWNKNRSKLLEFSYQAKKTGSQFCVSYFGYFIKLFFLA